MRAAHRSRRTIVAVLALGLTTLAWSRGDAQPVPPAEVPAAGAAPATLAPTANIPSPVSVKVKADPEEVTIGTPFKFSVEVTAPLGMKIIMAQPTERLGEFDIIDFGDDPPQEGTGMRTVTRWYRLAGFTTGYYKIESPPVAYQPPGGDPVEGPKAHTVVTVKSLLPENAEGADIRDIKAPEPLPIDWRPYYLIAGAVAAVALIGLLLWHLSHRKRAARALPPVPPHKIAYAELERLRGRKLIEQGAFKEYYSTLSDIVRTYLERRFEVRAPEMTTEEFLTSSAENGRLQRGHRGLLGDFLAESDLVKFARHVPTIADSERAYDAAKRFVDETREPEPEAGNGVFDAGGPATTGGTTTPSGGNDPTTPRGPDAIR